MPEVEAVRHLVIVGGGFAGAMLAVQFVRHGDGVVTLIERRPHVARGTAYAPADADYILNVHAANMSAFPDDPDHFALWRRTAVSDRGWDFASRRLYGDYLEQLFAREVETSGGRIRVLFEDAIDAEVGASSVSVVLANGCRVRGDRLVLAPGNLPSHPAACFVGLGPDIYTADPWTRDPASGLSPHDDVLLLGTGLTMADTALSLAKTGLGGRMIAISRRGLMPRANAARHEDAAGREPVLTGTLSRRLHMFREHARETGWRMAVDSLRPRTQAIWSGLSCEERRRFLRHLRPWWDVHRHRVAPAIGAGLADLAASGTLDIRAGKIEAATPAAQGVAVRWRPRGASSAETMAIRRIIDCTGPQSDIERTDDPLLRRLVQAGRLRADPARIGIDVNMACETIGASGIANPKLLAVGPLTRSAFWEIVAVPDIRVQVADVAMRLAGCGSARPVGAAYLPGGPPQVS